MLFSSFCVLTTRGRNTLYLSLGVSPPARLLAVRHTRSLFFFYSRANFPPFIAAANLGILAAHILLLRHSGILWVWVFRLLRRCLFATLSPRGGCGGKFCSVFGVVRVPLRVWLLSFSPFRRFPSGGFVASHRAIR